MTDFAKIIDRAIENDLRGEFERALRSFKQADRGRLSRSEKKLVRACFAYFINAADPTRLGFTEFKQLQDCLAKIAETEAPLLPSDVGLVRNTCFDALACIRALEARLRLMAQ